MAWDASGCTKGQGLFYTTQGGEIQGGILPFPRDEKCFAMELTFLQRLKVCALEARKISLFKSICCFCMGAGDRVEEIARWHLRARPQQSSHVGLSLGSNSYPEALSELLLSTPIH